MLTISEEVDLNTALKLSIKRYINSQQKCGKFESKATNKTPLKQNKKSLREGITYVCK